LTRMGLERLLAPASIAVVGANDRPGSYAAQTLVNLAAIGYPGEVWGVNPNRTEALGRPCVPTVSELPDAVDAVVVAIPAAGVPEVIDQVGARGCGGAVVFSAGFAEAPGGAELQRELVAAADRHGLPVCGPNCNGIVAMHARTALWGDALEPREPGHVALVSQSGNLAVNALATRRGLRFHTVIASGNQAVVPAANYLEALAADGGVRAIALYLEDDGGPGLCDGLAACAEASIPVVVLKVDSSPAGARAAAAHSAALAGDQRIFRALIEEAGAVWADDVHELLELSKTLAADSAPPRGRRLAIMTCSGGDSAQGADEVQRRGLELPAFSAATCRRLGQLLPAAATVANPLDYTSMIWGDSAALGELVQVVGEDPAIDQVLVFYDEPAGLTGASEQSWRAVRDGIITGAGLSPVPAMVSSTLPELLDDASAWRFAQARIPPVAGLRTGVRCAAAVAQPRASAIEASRLRAIAAAAWAAAWDGAGVWMAEHEAKKLLRAGGVNVVEGRLVDDEDDAVAALRELGGEIAMKVSAASIHHKSELGGVELELATEADVRRAYRRLRSLAAELYDDGDGGVLAERMADPGIELLIAARADGVVPALIAGLGGIWTEVLGDVAVIPLPADAARVERALRSLRGAPLLTGGRGRPCADLEAAAQLAALAGRLLLDQGLELVECNPVLVGPRGRGAVAVDAAVRRRAPAPARTPDADTTREGAVCTT
jgi:acetate---CoA ligase (ADP-forming)